VTQRLVRAGPGRGLVVRRVDRQVWSYIGLPEFRQLAGGVFLGGYSPPWVC
jgi:hypothetical protein